MRGTKRMATSDSPPAFNSTDSFLQSKRLTAGSLFGMKQTELSVQQPPLDMKRAESSRQHVRALNTQFASWIHTQLQNHPDELWEDGVQDYLHHAKSIMEKFSDVVSWLKANAARGDSLNQLPSSDSQMKPSSEIEKNSHKLFSDKPLFPASTAPGFEMSRSLGTTSNNSSQLGQFTFGDKLPFPASTAPSFETSWSPGTISNNSPQLGQFTFGVSQVSAPLNTTSPVEGNTQASDEAGREEDVEQPSSPSVKKSEEKGILTVHEVKCKLYVKSSDPVDKDAWKDKGVGHLSIKCKEGVSKGTKDSKPTVVIRNDVGKVLLNALLYPGIKTNLQKNSVVAIFHTSGDGDNSDEVVARTFLIRTKTIEERDKLADIIHEYAPAA